MFLSVPCANLYMYRYTYTCIVMFFRQGMGMLPSPLVKKYVPMYTCILTDMYPSIYPHRYIIYVHICIYMYICVYVGTY